MDSVHFLFPRIISTIFHIPNMVSSRARDGGVGRLLPRVVMLVKRDSLVPAFWDDGSLLVDFFIAKDQTRVGIEWIYSEGSTTPSCSPLSVPYPEAVSPRSTEVPNIAASSSRLDKRG